MFAAKAHSSVIPPLPLLIEVSFSPVLIASSLPCSFFLCIAGADEAEMRSFAYVNRWTLSVNRESYSYKYFSGGSKITSLNPLNLSFCHRAFRLSLRVDRPFFVLSRLDWHRS